MHYKLKNLLFNGLLVINSLVISLMLMEFIVRIGHIGPDIMAVYQENYTLSQNADLGYELLRGSPDGESSINADNMRDRDYAISKSPHTFRIACVGNSIAYGFGVPQQETYCKYLEYLLTTYYASSTLQFETLNFGVVGYNTTQVVENIRARVLKYNPDIIVYGYCLNDPQLLEENRILMRLRALLTRSEQNYVRSSTTKVFLEHSKAFRLMRYLLQRRQDNGQSQSSQEAYTNDPQFTALKQGKEVEYFNMLYHSDKTWLPVIQAFEKLSDITRQPRIPIYVLIFPYTTHTASFLTYPFQHLHEQIIHSTKQWFRVYDLLELYRGYQQVEDLPLYRDLIHPSPEGHRYTAMAILYLLLRHSAIPILQEEDYQKIMMTGSVEEQRFARLIRDIVSQKPRKVDGVP